MDIASSTCLGAGPDGMWTILDVTSSTLLQLGKSEADFPFSGHKWSLTPVHGSRFVTKMKWLFPFDPYKWRLLHQDFSVKGWKKN